MQDYTTKQNVCYVLFFSRPRSEGWPHHGRTFSIYFCPLSFWLTSTGSPVHVLMLSIQAVRGLPYLALFLALSLSPGNSLVSLCYDHSMLSSFLWQYLTVPSLLQPCKEPTHLFSLLSTKPAKSFSALSSQRRQHVFLHSFWVSSFHNRTLLQATLSLSLVVSLLKSVCCVFCIFSAVMFRSPALCLTWYGIPPYTHHLQ